MQLYHLLTDAAQVGSKTEQHSRGDPFTLTDQDQENVAGPGAAIAKIQCHLLRKLERGLDF